MSPGRWWLLLLAAVTLCTFANSLANGFVWDDEFIIVDNPQTRDPGGVAKLLLEPDVLAPYYRPLTRSSYLLDYRLFGLRPAGFHAVSVALHLANVWLLYLLALRLFRRRGPALCSALLLAVHPVNAEAVNFLSGRNNLLVLALMLASILLFDEARLRDSALWAAGSAAAFLAAVLSKESGALTPLLIVAWTLLVARERAGPRGLAWTRLLLPHLAAAAIYALLRARALGGLLGTGEAARPLLERLVANLYTIPSYLGLVLFPRRLTIFHEIPPDALRQAWLPAAWLAILLIAGLAVRRSAPAVRFGLAWFAVNLLPVANVVPIPSAPIAERYLYVPAVGLWILIAYAGASLVAATGARRILTAAAVLLLAALAFRTVGRNRDWRSDLALFRSASETDVASPLGPFNTGNAWLDLGRMAEARAAWEEALRREPGHAGALTQLGTLAASRGDLETAERLYRRALDAPGGNPLARFNLARLLERSGRPLEAAELYRRFLEEVPVEYREYEALARERLEALRP